MGTGSNGQISRSWSRLTAESVMTYQIKMK